MQRVVIVSNLFPPTVVGGAEIVAHRQACALAAQGVDVAVFAGGFAREGWEAGSLVLEMTDGFPVYRIALASLDPGENFHRPETERRFLSLLATHQPDIVHVHNPGGLGMNLIPAAKGFGARVVVTLHDHWGVCFKNTLLRNDGRVCPDVEACAVCLPATVARDGAHLPIRLRRDYVAWCLDQADQLLSPSRYLADFYETTNVVRRPTQALSNGIPGEHIPVSDKPAPDPLQFACFSYLGEHKGIPTLLAAAEALARDPAMQGRWHLTIAGHGHLAEGLVGDIAAGRFGEAVSFAGRLAHADALVLLARVHVVVLASHWPENEPVTLLEAIASGTAQLASRIGGNVELVADEASGLLVTPGDPEALAAAMRRFVDEPDLARKFGAYNAARRDAFDEARIMERLRALYETVPDAPAPDDLVVVCAGRERSRAFALKLQLMLDRFHIVEDKPRRIRFIWHGWAGPQVWRRARLLWLWGETGEADLPLVLQALRAGVPVLAPADSPLARVTERGGDVGTYETLLDAVGRIAALQDVESEAALAPNGASAARFLTALAPRTSFHLPVRELA